MLTLKILINAKAFILIVGHPEKRDGQLLQTISLEAAKPKK